MKIEVKNIYMAKKKKRSRSAYAHLGYILGRGFVKEYLKCSYECWCVIDAETSKVICDAKSKAIAEEIAIKMNT